MREIKFRAWDKNLNADGGMIWNVPILNGKYFDAYKMETHDHPLMQYTGLKDKNGIEIYEGDIIMVDNGIGYKADVYFRDGAFRRRPIGAGEASSDCLCYLYDSEDYEVIGNKYEDVDLHK